MHAFLRQILSRVQQRQTKPLIIAATALFLIAAPGMQIAMARELPAAYVQAFPEGKGLEEAAVAAKMQLFPYSGVMGEWAILLQPAHYPATVSLYDGEGFTLKEGGFDVQADKAVAVYTVNENEGCILSLDSVSEGIPNYLITVKNSNGVYSWAPAFSGMDGSLITDDAFVPLEKKKGASAQAAPATVTSSIGIEFVFISAGEFVMGAADNKTFRTYADETPPHTVRIEKPFYLGKYEVTQGQWEAVMGSNPSVYQGMNNPVDSIRWKDAQEFVRRINEMEGHGRYRLPTEAEWEYAARADSETFYFFGNDPATLDEYAWHGGNSSRPEGNSAKKTHPVGRKKPNAFGLCDIYGNVYELVQDSAYPGSDPVARGGSWNSLDVQCTSVFRYIITPDTMKFDHTGLRLALSIP